MQDALRDEDKVDVEGKVAVITGASRGIGAATAQLFASRGAKVVVAARTLNEGDHPRLSGSLASTVDSIRRQGGEAFAVACDVSNEESCLELIDEARSEYGGVDILVNNAALSYFTPFQETATNRWVRAFAVNVHGPFVLTKAVLPGMIAKRRGAIVNVSSMRAIGPGRGPYRPRGFRSDALYGATKAALERMTQSIAQEVYEHNVSVSCVSPSLLVPTEGTVFHHLVESLDQDTGESPLTVADAILLLASQPAQRVSGRVCYSQEILLEFGQIDEGRGYGVTLRGSGYSER